MSEDPKQPLIAPPPYPSAPPPAYAPPGSSSHTTVITTAPVISATTVVIRPRTYLVWSILSLIWCPLIGIFALLFSLKVDSEWDAGRYEEAHNASRMARLLNVIGLICHVVVVTAIIISIAVTV